LSRRLQPPAGKIPEFDHIDGAGARQVRAVICWSMRKAGGLWVKG
jgi:hypothetical protein